MKSNRAGLLVMTVVLGCAAYFRSWWLVMAACFVFVVEYMAQECDDIKERLGKIESKLDDRRKQ
jgi:hypothetical protein